MANATIIIPPDLSNAIGEREKVWSDIERARGLAGELQKLSSKVPDCAPSKLQSHLSTQNIPPAELESAFLLLKKELELINRLKAEVKGCHDEIEKIKKQEKTFILSAAIAVVVVLFILILVVFS